MPVSLKHTPNSGNNGEGNGNPHNTDNKSSKERLERLRPYEFHGVHLEQSSGKEAIGDCPFCDKENKFSVNLETGLWKCWVCGSGSSSGGGNALTFIRLIYEQSLRNTTDDFIQHVALDRLITSSSVKAWGVTQARDGLLTSWLVPGFGTDGKLDQLYKRVAGKLLPTPGIWSEGKQHALHIPALIAGDFDPKRTNIIVCEGPWDGMALWEVDRQIWGDTNIVAVPGCNVWRDEWTQMCKDKVVTLLYDSDHPNGPNNISAGWAGVQRVCKKLSGIASLVRVLVWGPNGYDVSKPSGWDIRDTLSSAKDRRVALVEILSKIQDAPKDWFSVSKTSNSSYTNGKETRECSTWEKCKAAWDKEEGGAIMLRQDLSDVMAVCLAICASTQQSGNQLFLDIIGSPGSGKTTICQGLLTSENCVALENMTKLISGWKKEGDNTADCSFLARSNNKTWITCEFDVLGSSPEYSQLMGKVRRIFDGETTATYGNDDKDRAYTLLRTPWIRCGTHKMMDRMADNDQSQLGDRFLRIIIGDPNHSEKRQITRSALRSERNAMLNQATGPSGSTVDPKTQIAQAMMGGYVNWLRSNIDELLAKLDVSESVEDYCIDLAELSADLRARPNEGRYAVDSHDTKEMPTRLARQNIRLASCLAVVLNKQNIDNEVLRIVRKVAMDTASGHSLNIVHWLCGINQRDPKGRTYQECGGIGMETIAMWSNMTPDRCHRYLMFLRKIDVLNYHQKGSVGGAWILTDRVHDLYTRIIEGVK